MRNHFRGMASVTVLVVASFLFSFSVVAQQTAQQLPKALQAPDGEELFLKVHATGDQIYACKGDGAQFAWTLKAPDAQLFDKEGKSFGKHFAGPSWEANDGS